MSDEDNDLDDMDEVEEDGTVQDEADKPSPIADLAARRRLEDRLEERRLQKLIQDYDFDIA